MKVFYERMGSSSLMAILLDYERQLPEIKRKGGEKEWLNGVGTMKAV